MTAPGRVATVPRAARPLDVVVVGGGIAGLAAAVALLDSGHSVQVVERDRPGDRRQSDGGWHLWSNAVRALRVLGLEDRVRDVGAHLERTEYLSASGSPLATWQIGALGRAVGAGDLGVSRERLHAVLRDAVEERGGREALLAGVRVREVRQSGGSVEVLLDGEGVLRPDLVVGADGIRSAVRRGVLGPREPRSAGYTQWQALLPREVAGGLPAGVERVVFGRGVRAVVHEVGDGRVFWAGIHYGPAATTGPVAALEHLASRLGGFPSPVPELLLATPPEVVNGHEIHALPPSDSWVRGRVGLVGDAAHAMTTNLSQGACLALEDAVVLADCLARIPDVPAALQRYQRRRVPRVQPLVRRSWRVAQLGSWRSGAACAVRDVVLGAALRTVALRDHESLVTAHP